MPEALSRLSVWAALAFTHLSAMIQSPRSSRLFSWSEDEKYYGKALCRTAGRWVLDYRHAHFVRLYVYAFKRGMAPESMQRAFPLLTLEEIYGAITFYLAHVQEVDVYLERSEAEFVAQAHDLNAAAQAANPALFQRLARHTRKPTRP